MAPRRRAERGRTVSESSAAWRSSCSFSRAVSATFGATSPSAAAHSAVKRRRRQPAASASGTQGRPEQLASEAALLAPAGGAPRRILLLWGENPPGGGRIEHRRCYPPAWALFSLAAGAAGCGAQEQSSVLGRGVAALP